MIDLQITETSLSYYIGKCKAISHFISAHFLLGLISQLDPEIIQCKYLSPKRVSHLTAKEF